MDVIWNLTRICPWDCAICCISAMQACETTKYYLKRKQKKRGRELTLAEKIIVLKDLSDEGFEVDFSGGDPLYYDDDLQVVEQATIWMLPEKICVSMTGVELTERKIEVLKGVKGVEFTIDFPPNSKHHTRPEGFHLSSLLALKKCVKAGIRTRGVTVLYPYTIKESNLRKVYKILCGAGVSEWELLRFYPVGRGRRFLAEVPTREEYLRAMDLVRGFKGTTKIFFQHSLQMLEGNGVCPAVRESIGILPDGQVVACAWALNNQGQPIDGHFILGKVPDQKIRDIIDSAQGRAEFKTKVHESRIIEWLGRQKNRKE